MKRGMVLAIGAVIVALMLVTIYVLVAGTGNEGEETDKDRLESIPSDAVKALPSSDIYPPELHSPSWQSPVPVPGPINTAGAEDSPFVLPDGSGLYFFFTPDVRKPANEQLFDGVSGIWYSQWNGSGWSEPSRVWLQDKGKLALDGAAFVQGDEMWFASAREGYTDVNLFIADFENGHWADWQYAGDLLNVQYEVGEMHITADGQHLFFHSGRTGGQGGLDIWRSDMVGGQWQEPVNVEEVNSAGEEGWPFISQDGNELWFTRTYLGSPGVFRSTWTDGSWSEPELIVSSFAGEPTLDQEGNLYFVHHFFDNGTMIEADIYVAYRS
ncbi:MAG: hypothetical protein LUQ16_08910 [Methanomassiliicoccales archaeon]|nr:hypothetical protein [Methanomassiliicoccales archaeon]